MATAPNEMKRLLVAGAGGFGSEVASWLDMRGVNLWQYLDDTKAGCIKIDDFKPEEGDQVLVCIGDPRGRMKVVTRLQARGAVFHGLLWHLCPPTARVGGGCVTMPQSVISAHASVGDFVHINFNSTVGHHVTLGDFCTLSSHVDLCGHVSVGHGVFFGSGARVLPGVRIGDFAKIGAGSVVIKDVGEGESVFGVPAVKL